MIAWLKYAGNRLLGPQRSDWHPIAHRLGQSYNIGLDSGMFKTKPATGAGKSGLHFIHD